MPHRLLQKRMLLFPKQSDEFCDGHYDNNSDCHYEWLVKWTGLGYEHATWELDNASFFMSPESTQLISDYESRHKKAERLSSAYKADEVLLIMRLNIQSMVIANYIFVFHTSFYIIITPLHL